MNLKKISVFFILCGLSACAVGPDYTPPPVQVPVAYKEAPEGWKFATPCDLQNRGPWWEIFEDATLNDLETQLTLSNQNIKAAFAQYEQARALVAAARSNYFPIVSGSASVTRQKPSTGRSATATGASTPGSATISTGQPFTDYNLELDASWAPDIWGSVRRMVESAEATAEADLVAVAAARLLAQASLAQFYFELRGLDNIQQTLNQTVISYQQSLQITQNQYTMGIVSKANVLQAQSVLASAEVAALDNGILRAQYEHAIAVLIGQLPSCFSITPFAEICEKAPPAIPVEIPSTLLERRPDIAQSERLMAAANAQIGVAIAAYFPVLTLNASGGFNSTSLSRLFTKPAQFWSIGSQLFQTFFDGGLRRAQVAQARAAYDQTLATYRQTVLSAFQNVEDNLAALRILESEVAKQNEAVITAQQSLKIVMNQYKAGTVGQLEVLTAQVTLFSAQRSENTLAYRRMLATVGLIQALGGDWQTVHSPE